MFVDPDGRDTTFKSKEAKAVFDAAFNDINNRIKKVHKKLNRVEDGLVNDQGSIDYDKLSGLDNKKMEKLLKITSGNYRKLKQIQQDFNVIISKSTPEIIYEIDESLNMPALTNRKTLEVFLRNTYGSFANRGIVIHENRHVNQILNGAKYTLHSEIEAYRYQRAYDSGFVRSFINQNSSSGQLSEAVEYAYPKLIGR